MLAQDLLFGKKACGGVPSKRAGAHSYLQTRVRYRRLVEKFQEGHCTIKSSIAL
jgi:hypothetical protein